MKLVSFSRKKMKLSRKKTNTYSKIPKAPIGVEIHIQRSSLTLADICLFSRNGLLLR